MTRAPAPRQASIHNDEEHLKAFTACKEKVGDIPDPAALSNADATPHGCWIGLGDQFREGRCRSHGR